MTFQKRKKNIGVKDPSKKRKKRQNIKKDDGPTVPKAEFLDIKTIREGMLLLGCIIEIRSDCLLLSLPGCLVGKVPITNISKKFTHILKKSAEDESSDEVNLENLFDIGSTFPCKVLNVTRYESKKPNIMLSIDPRLVNSNLYINSLYSNMVLYAAVTSIEDHGYIMDVGIKGAKGFIPFNASISSNLLNVGKVIPTYLKEIPNKNLSECVLSLSTLSFEDNFPEIPEENVKLSAILPGMKVSAFVTEVTKRFLYLKCFDYDACCSSLTVFKEHKKIKEGSTVSGKVLYIHPLTNLMYICIGSLPTPETFDNFFGLHKFDKIKNLKFVTLANHKLFFKHQNSIGYVKAKDVSGKTSLSVESLAKNPIVSKARVVFLHYIDRLIQLTFDETLMKMKIVKLEDVKIGDIYEATVKKHIKDGMFVSICPGLSGFIRYIQLSDSYVTMPEKLHPVGGKIQCRVLSIHPTSGLNLTSKESLMIIPDNELLKCYSQALIGKLYKGVIVKMSDNYLVILFFNNVQGIVGSDNMLKNATFFVGQTVQTVVIQSNYAKKKLSLSLNYEKYRQKQEQRNTVGNITNTNNKSQPMEITSDLEEDAYDNQEDEGKEISPVKENKEISRIKNDQKVHEFVEGKLYKAFITKITAHQLNITVNGTVKGRIHITRLGCTDEGVLPLKQFTVGQRLKVYVLKEYKKHSKNFLSISHQNWSYFLECSLTFPPFEPIFDANGSCKESIFGFIKQISECYASVWITPDQSGILNFTNISKSPKVLRKFKKQIKIGQSLAVSVLNVVKKKEGKLMLSTPGMSNPEVGKNIVGFITIACLNKGLILKLAHGYSGSVCLTDIQDVYTPLQHTFEKLEKLKFILCHVLEVNHSKKTCILSLRKSRLYTSISKSDNIDPEITINNLEQGKIIKGYIKSKFDTYIILNIGRNLEGKLLLHKCVKYRCKKCQKVSEVLKSSEIGNVMEVTVDNSELENNFVPLSLPEMPKMDSVESASLHVKEDINWEELQ